MKARSIKFQLLLWFMIFLFGGYLGLSIYFTKDVSAGVTDAEIPVIDAPNIDADVVQGGSGEDDDQAAKIPTGVFPLINYALDLYNNGNGSLSYGTLSVTNEGSLPAEMFPGMGGIKVHGTQYAAFKIARNQTQNLEESYFYYNVDPVLENILVSGGLLRFGYRSINVDEKSGTVICCETNKTTINKGDKNNENWKHDFTDASATRNQYSIDDALNIYKVIYSRDFPLEINEKTCRIVSKNLYKDPQYAYITVQYDKSKLPSQFNSYYHANGGLQDVVYTNYTFEFKISRKTGRLSQLIRREEFTSYALNGKVKIDSTATFIQTFQNMDASINVPQIYTEWTKG